MLSAFDDYPIHQTPDPILTRASTDPDVYERYWFNGYSNDGEVFFAIGTALYPHLGIQDCGLSVIIDGRQHAFHASARANAEPTDLRVGPFDLNIVEPMRSCRITIDGADPRNDTGWSCDLLFEGRTANIEESRHTIGRGPRPAMDATRFTQLGTWTGWISFEGHRIEVGPERFRGTKDRSWGYRPLAGGDQRAAPPRPDELAERGLFFLWAPINFDDVCAHYQLFEDVRGRPYFSVAALLPTYDGPDDLPGVEDPAAVHMKHLEHEVVFDDDSRMISAATLGFTEIDTGTRHELQLERIGTFRMKGIGYDDPEWGHGMWKGDLAMASESWGVDELDDTARENIHVQHIVRARLGDRVGLGVLEQLIVGPYAPYGLTTWFGR